MGQLHLTLPGWPRRNVFKLTTLSFGGCRVDIDNTTPLSAPPLAACQLNRKKSKRRIGLLLGLGENALYFSLVSATDGSELLRTGIAGRKTHNRGDGDGNEIAPMHDLLPCTDCGSQIIFNE